MEEQHASTSLTRPDAETLLKVAFLHELLILLISSNIMIGGGGGFLECEYQGSKTNCAEKGGGGGGAKTGTEGADRTSSRRATACIAHRAATTMQISLTV